MTFPPVRISISRPGCQNQNKNAEAETAYRRAIAIDPKFEVALYNLGLLLRGRKKTQEGNAEVQTAVNLDPSLRPKAIAQGVPLTGS
jgi:tetratricopeptide (TPR) repeat protein